MIGDAAAGLRAQRNPGQAQRHPLNNQGHHLNQTCKGHGQHLNGRNIQKDSVEGMCGGDVMMSEWCLYMS